MKVVVVGGGLGGLALAAGLRRTGTEVRVLERDTDLAATGGYHITLHAPAQAALARLLPPVVLEQVLASAADGRLRDPDVLWDPRGRRIGRVRLKGTDRGVDIDRITLRLLLAEAVGTDLCTGRTFSRFEQHEDRVRVHLEDGEQVDADLLVGADGVHSRVARQLAGGPTNAPTGVVGVSGRTPVEALEEATRRRLGTRSSLGIGPHATALYLGYLDPVGQAVLDAPALRRSATTEATFVWGAMFAGSEHTRALPRHDGPALLEQTAALLAGRGWTTAMTEVITRSDPGSGGVFGFHAAPADARRQAPWPAGRVTALGDAVHATPPTAGMGAGAAIRDAAHLCEELDAVHHRDKPLRLAVRDFQAGTRTRGEEVVSASLPTIGQILATATPVGAALTTAALPVLAAAHALGRPRRADGRPRRR